tara:strand:+ start:2352 stop:2741 length:390 start_codon:yes stop_codon:yes gene_type:complete
MPKPRELTDIEKFYIQNNLQKNDSELASGMSGVGPKTVAKYRQEVNESAVNDASEKSKRESVEESREERIDRLSRAPDAGELMSRRDGVSIMTQQASEVTDARKIVKGNNIPAEEFEAKNRDKIHRPKS